MACVEVVIATQNSLSIAPEAADSEAELDPDVDQTSHAQLVVPKSRAPVSVLPWPT